MLTTCLRSSTLAFLALLGLLFATACEPGTFDQDQPVDQDPAADEQLDQDEPIGGGPDDPWAQPDDPTMDDPAMDDPAMDDPAMDDPALPTAQDGFEQGMEDINRGVNEITAEAQRLADELGQDVDEATQDIQERVRTFQEEIQRDIEALRAGEADQEAPAEDQPGTM